MTRSVWDVLQAMLRDDAAAPRVTFYERTPGATAGERVELSAKVLVNWVSKAANLLTEELEVCVGSRVVVHLPAAHWRTVYWCLAAWSVGAQVAFVDADEDARMPGADMPDGDVLVTCDPSDACDGDLVVVTLAMLARASSAQLPAGAVDEARELSTFGDVFTPFDVPAPTSAALSVTTGSGDERELSFADLTTPTRDAGRRFLASPSPKLVLGALAGGGSVVLVRGDVDADALTPLLEQESARAC